MEPLPIDEVVPELCAVLARDGVAVLQAPPGAGKTTRVPLALLEAGLAEGGILMLEPRRIAARTAAQRMAETLGEKVGQTVGFRIRGESVRGARIEVVTEGILSRMIQSDPALEGVGMVIFDEFHERSLNADLGLALTLEARAALRNDLKLLVMSATVDAGPVAELIGAKTVTSEGRAYPVETRWLDTPRRREARFDADMAALIRRALDESEGSILAFLPGEGEIRRVRERLGHVKDIEVLLLYGAMPFAEQRRALRPGDGRRVVLATSIAETSLTIPDVRVVVDGGLARRARYDPGSGMSRLVTERVSLAEADQRRGRAGRVAEGICYRLWTKGEEGALPAHPPPEIETADLAGLALELAEWGEGDLPFLTPPPEGVLGEARSLLSSLGALDTGGGITAHGREMVRMPLHPRLAHMLAVAGKPAALLAALLADRDPMRGSGVDLAKRLGALRGSSPPPHARSILAERDRLTRLAKGTSDLDAAEQAALAYPDRIALRRPGDDPRWLLSGGKGAKMDAADDLAGQRMLVVTDTDGHPTEATIRTALAIGETQVRALFADRIEIREVVEWSRREGRVVARIEDRLGALVLKSKPWKDVPDDRVARAMLDGVHEMGLPDAPAARRLRDRVALLRKAGRKMPDMSDEALLDTLETWLLPHLTGVRTAGGWANFDLLPALRAMLDWPQSELLEREAPPHFETPLGRQIAIGYEGGTPNIALKLQEMFGVTRHPTAAGVPLRVTLLSPAGRALQTTTDIPGFWTGSYPDVRKDMRGRYPKHPWPEDPTDAAPTLRTKRKGG